MSDVSTWTIGEAGNDKPAPNGAPEGQTPQSLNNVMREIMAAVRRWYAEPEWLDLAEENTVAKEDSDSVRVTGFDGTIHWTVGRRVKLTGGGDTKGFVTAVTFAASDTVVDILTDGAVEIPAGTDAILAFHSQEITSAAFGAALTLQEAEFFLYQ